MRIAEIDTPALLVEADALDRNIGVMAEALPRDRLRPHVKAHKCTSLARRQAESGHSGFTCATIRECEGMSAAGLGQDLLLANEVLDARRLGVLIESGARVTLAVDSEETIAAAAEGGVREVVIDVNVGLPRCGCPPDDAGRLADIARHHSLDVRGVMGYEGHVVGLVDAAERAEQCQAAMELLLAAHADVGGDLITAGGTGTYALNTWANEIQAGSYALMDTAYGKLGLPFEQAAYVLATVISSSPSWSVGDAGLKAFGMDHGNPSLTGNAEGQVLFCSDEHVTIAPSRRVGEQIFLAPAHIDPTMAYHERLYLFSGDDVVDIWPIDLRGW
ncbi:MAG: alanine racemase [Actinobacteria bacterium]|nr:alanine racemase [Actinomycetota bacterium]MBO0834224.1 alanine racemase [Actinomycetota bacterium]